MGLKRLLNITQKFSMLKLRSAPERGAQEDHANDRGVYSRPFVRVFSRDAECLSSISVFYLSRIPAYLCHNKTSETVRNDYERTFWPDGARSFELAEKVFGHSTWDFVDRCPAEIVAVVAVSQDPCIWQLEW